MWSPDVLYALTEALWRNASADLSACCCCRWNVPKMMMTWGDLFCHYWCTVSVLTSVCDVFFKKAVNKVKVWARSLRWVNVLVIAVSGVCYHSNKILSHCLAWIFFINMHKRVCWCLGQYTYFIGQLSFCFQIVLHLHRQRQRYYYLVDDAAKEWVVWWEVLSLFTSHCFVKMVVSSS